MRALILPANGHHLEATLGKVMKNNAREGAIVLLAEKAVPEPFSSPEVDGGAPDPHCWMNVKFFQGYAKHALDALVKADPDNAGTYRSNSEKYNAELNELHNWILEQVRVIL